MHTVGADVGSMGGAGRVNMEEPAQKAMTGVARKITTPVR
jgi:hypothetical protein